MPDQTAEKPKSLATEYTVFWLLVPVTIGVALYIARTRHGIDAAPIVRVIGAGVALIFRILTVKAGAEWSDLLGLSENGKFVAMLLSLFWPLIGLIYLVSRKQRES